MGWGAKFGLYKKLCRLGLVWFFQIWKSYLSFKGLTVSILLLLRENGEWEFTFIASLEHAFWCLLFLIYEDVQEGHVGAKKAKGISQKDNTRQY